MCGLGFCQGEYGTSGKCLGLGKLCFVTCRSKQDEAEFFVCFFLFCFHFHRLPALDKCPITTN